MSTLKNYNIVLEIDVDPSGTSNFVEVAEGFNNLDQNLNEVIHQTSYFGDAGWGSSEVIGGQLIVTLTGDRIVGDTAQDYIFGDEVMFNFDNRKTTFRITDSVNVIEGDVTICNITNSGGDAQGVSAISCELHFNGAPTITAV